MDLEWRPTDGNISCRKVKILLGNISQELQLKVQIDKDLVSLPCDSSTNRNHFHTQPANSIEDFSYWPNISDSEGYTNGTYSSYFLQRNVQNSLSTPVDLTVLFDLAKFADLKPNPKRFRTRHTSAPDRVVSKYKGSSKGSSKGKDRFHYQGQFNCRFKDLRHKDPPSRLISDSTFTKKQKKDIWCVTTVSSSEAESLRFKRIAPNENNSSEVMGDRSLGDRLLGDRLLGDRLLADRLLGDRLLGDRSLDSSSLSPNVTDSTTIPDGNERKIEQINTNNSEDLEIPSRDLKDYEQNINLFSNQEATFVSTLNDSDSRDKLGASSEGERTIDNTNENHEMTSNDYNRTDHKSELMKSEKDCVEHCASSVLPDLLDKQPKMPSSEFSSFDQTNLSLASSEVNKDTYERIAMSDAMPDNKDCLTKQEEESIFASFTDVHEGNFKNKSELVAERIQKDIDKQVKDLEVHSVVKTEGWEIHAAEPVKELNIVTDTNPLKSIGKVEKMLQIPQEELFRKQEPLVENRNHSGSGVYSNKSPSEDGVNRNQCLSEGGTYRNQNLFKDGVNRTQNLDESGMYRNQNPVENGLHRTQNLDESGVYRNQNPVENGMHRTQNPDESGMYSNQNPVENGMHRTQNPDENGMYRNENPVESGMHRTQNLDENKMYRNQSHVDCEVNRNWNPDDGEVNRNQGPSESGSNKNQIPEKEEMNRNQSNYQNATSDEMQEALNSVEARMSESQDHPQGQMHETHPKRGENENGDQKVPEIAPDDCTPTPSEVTQGDEENISPCPLDQEMEEVPGTSVECDTLRQHHLPEEAIGMDLTMRGITHTMESQEQTGESEGGSESLSINVMVGSLSQTDPADNLDIQYPSDLQEGQVRATETEPLDISSIPSNPLLDLSLKETISSSSEPSQTLPCRPEVENVSKKPLEIDTTGSVLTEKSSLLDSNVDHQNGAQKESTGVEKEEAKVLEQSENMKRSAKDSGLSSDVSSGQNNPEKKAAPTYTIGIAEVVEKSYDLSKRMTQQRRFSSQLTSLAPKTQDLVFDFSTTSKKTSDLIDEGNNLSNHKDVTPGLEKLSLPPDAQNTSTEATIYSEKSNDLTQSDIKEDHVQKNQALKAQNDKCNLVTFESNSSNLSTPKILSVHTLALLTQSVPFQTISAPVRHINAHHYQNNQMINERQPSRARQSVDDVIHRLPGQPLSSTPINPIIPDTHRAIVLSSHQKDDLYPAGNKLVLEPSEHQVSQTMEHPKLYMPTQLQKMDLVLQDNTTKSPTTSPSGLVLDQEKVHENQQNFQEIKKHLLSSKSSVTTEMGLPVGQHMAHQPQEGVQNYQVTPLIVTISSDSKSGEETEQPGSLNKFHCDMMEHVNHWKAQNENMDESNASAKKQAVALKTPVSPPQQLYQIGKTPTPSPPGFAMASLPVHIPKQNPKVPLKTNTEVLSSSHREQLENLQAIHKMYFKTMQSEKLPPAPQKVVYGMGQPPSAVFQAMRPMMPTMPHTPMMPRFPPNIQFPPQFMPMPGINVLPDTVHSRMVPQNIPVVSWGEQVRGIPLSAQPFLQNPNQFHPRFHSPPAQVANLIQKGNDLVPPEIAAKFPEMQLLSPTTREHILLTQAIALKNKAIAYIPQSFVVPISAVPEIHEKQVIPAATISKKEEALSLVAREKEKRKVEESSEGSPLDLSTVAAKRRRLESVSPTLSNNSPLDLTVKKDRLLSVGKMQLATNIEQIQLKNSGSKNCNDSTEVPPPLVSVPHGTSALPSRVATVPHGVVPPGVTPLSNLPPGVTYLPQGMSMFHPEGSSTVHHRANTVHQGASPGHQAGSNVHHGLGTVHHGVNMVHHEANTVHHESNMVHHGSNMVHYGGNMMLHGGNMMPYAGKNVHHVINAVHHGVNSVPKVLSPQLSHVHHLLHPNQNQTQNIPVRSLLENLKVGDRNQFANSMRAGLLSPDQLAVRHQIANQMNASQIPATQFLRFDGLTTNQLASHVYTHPNYLKSKEFAAAQAQASQLSPTSRFSPGSRISPNVIPRFHAFPPQLRSPIPHGTASIMTLQGGQPSSETMQLLTQEHLLRQMTFQSKAAEHTNVELHHRLPSPHKPHPETNRVLISPKAIPVTQPGYQPYVPQVPSQVESPRSQHLSEFSHDSNDPVLQGMDSLKRKRGRPRGSTNKKRQPSVSEGPPAEVKYSHPVGLVEEEMEEVHECQFCDYKASSRGDVRQHVKEVHFAKFRRDSRSTASEPTTPSTEAVPQPHFVIHPAVTRDSIDASRHGEELRHNHEMFSSPTMVNGTMKNYSSISTDDAELMLDLHRRGEAQSLKESSVEQKYTNSDGRHIHEINLMEEIPSSYEGSELEMEPSKPPLKLTLRRVSSNNNVEEERACQPRQGPEKKAKYFCEVCGASYNYINGLREHESRHKLDHPHECMVCHLKYKTAGMLNRHQAQKGHNV